MYITAIIAAAGHGRRLGGAVPKQLLPIGGRPILERSVATFLDHPEIAEVVVALPAEFVADAPPYLRVARKPLHLVAGGERRQDSVLNAFNACSERSELIVIHDAARPFASPDLVSRTIAAAAESGAALAALPVLDTVKEATPAHRRREGYGGRDAGPYLAPEEGGHYVHRTIPRETIYLAQTPQAFRRDVLRDALALAETGIEVTDEATLAERAGHTVWLVQGEPSNIKVTTATDLQLAEVLAGGGTSAAPMLRVGTGYDLHRMVEGRLLTLAGVTIPFERGLLGYSDADAICHAVIDAMLGAAAAGDIGGHFPDTDTQWKGVSSIDLLRRVSAIIGQRGFAVVNVDVVVIAERPKLGGYVDAMRRNLADAIGIRAADVSIKGKTNEGVGELGRGEALAVHAVALLKQS
jgi:2-C-methyl-D-erythritol 4-phosphate cytidylyltransferase/2-C-methyl-D-erythritol 2,4-cyclodiphosphate synthase